MKSSSLPCGVVLLIVSSMLGATPVPQQQPSFTGGGSGTLNVDWSGVSGRTYFVQWSLDLVNWNYSPIIKFGTGVQSCGVATSNAEGFFVRLHYVDDTTATTLQQAKDADFDNDGIPNNYEVVTLGTDPLDKNSAGGDSDNDGLADGWEKFYFGGLNVAAPNAIQSGDGLTNKEKSELGLNPNVNYSAVNASQSAKFDYDPTGRLTGVTAPIRPGNYTPDEEGNLLNAQ